LDWSSILRHGENVGPYGGVIAISRIGKQPQHTRMRCPDGVLSPAAW
jgi:hypothetical protein